MTTTRPLMLYLVGRPGAGKSTLMAALTAGLPFVERKQPVAHLDYGGRVVQLGRNREGFPGTDTLGMASIVTVQSWVSSNERPMVLLGEGDRLATPKFFDHCRAAGYETTVVGVVSPNDTVQQRRAARTDWHPNEAWLRGRDTKAAKLCAAADLVVPGDDLEQAWREISLTPVGDVLVRLRHGAPVAG